jgi:anaerobic ribonucleoside-triphosphate reductase
MIADYLGLADWRINENSNTGWSLQGLNHHLSSSAVARYWLEEVYPKSIRDAHISGAMHIHDLGMLSAYCCGWDLQDILSRGWGGVAGKPESSPPKHLSSALGQLITFLFTMSGEIAGAVAISNMDTLLAPFIRFDNLSYLQVKQLLQEFIFAMNNATRVGFQAPFSNVTLDLTPSPALKNTTVEIGGIVTPYTYGEFQAEMDIFNRAFAEVVYQGDAKGRVFTFPIPTYNITEDFDWDNPVYQPIWEMTARYGVPYFANFINSGMHPEDVRSMCCRLRLNNGELRKRMGGLFAAAPLTGSIGVVTLNMARIGYEAVDKADFITRLGELMDRAYHSLEIKRQVVEEYTEKGLYPYAKVYLDNVKMATGKYWSNHFSTIGLNGMHEACLNLLGVGIETPEGKQFAEEVLDTMLTILQHYQHLTHNLYNLEASPAESAAYRMAKADMALYPDIITSGVSEAPYYTNSTQLPVGMDELTGMLDHQESLQLRYTGGTVAHVFLGEALPKWELARAIVKTITTNWKLPYITITPTFSICMHHGYISGEHETCPECGRECEIYSRVVGYLSPRQRWNVGKKQEAKDRGMFSINGM